jgi:hypothetical protein
MEELTGISVEDAIRLITVAPPQDAILLVGPPGFGKSACPRIAAQIMKARYWPMYAGTKEAVELQGLPHLSRRGGRLYGDWAPFQGMFPLKDEDHSGPIIINLDDIGHAAPSVVKAAVRCVYGDGDKRYMGNHELYSDIRIVGTSNLHTHRAGAHRFETYVTNRITQVSVLPDALQWCTWALEHGVNPLVASFVRWKRTVTDFTPEKDAFMSPRSLEKLGRFVDSLAASNTNGSILRAVTLGTIGPEAGSEFLAYHALAADLPDMDDFFAGKKIKIPTRPEVQYMFVSTVVQAAGEKDIPLVTKLIGDMTEKGGAGGFEVAAFLTFECLKGSAKKLRGVATQQGLYKWLQEYGKYLPALLGIAALGGLW